MSGRRVITGMMLPGIPGKDITKPLAIAYGPRVPDAAASAWSWETGLTELPQVGPSEVKPFETNGRVWAAGSATFTVSVTDRFAALFLREERFPENNFTSFVTTLVDTVTLAVPATLPVLYAGDETMRIISGTNPYTVERQALGSPLQSHEAGTFVGEHTGYWVPREVAIVWHDLDTGEEGVCWRGYIDSIGNPKATIKIPATEFYTRWSQAPANQNAPNLNASGQFVSELGTRIRGASHALSDTRTTTGPVTLHIAGGLVQGTWVEAGAVNNERAYFAGQWTQDDALLGSTLEIPEQPLPTPLPGEVFEVLLWDRLNDIAPIDGDDRFHPVRIAKELLKRDQLAERWALELAIDEASFDAAIAATPDLQIDYLLLGEDGAEYLPMDIAESLLVIFGWNPAQSQDAQYGIERFKLLDIAAFAEALDAQVMAFRDGPLERINPPSTSSSEITAEVGGGVSWRKAVSSLVRSDGISKRGRLMKKRERSVYKATMFDARRSIDVALQLADSARLLHFGLPGLRFRTADHRITGADYGDLKHVYLTDIGLLLTPWWTDANGVRVDSLEGRIDAVGTIVSRTPILRSQTYELTVLLLAFNTGTYARERAPAAVVASRVGDVITVANKLHPEEASFFTQFDQVMHWSRDGREIGLGAVGTVNSINGNEIDCGGLTPEPGDIIRLANSRSYGNATRYPFTDRPYVHLANAAGLITRFSTTEPADPYGGGLGVSYGTGGRAAVLNSLDAGFVGLHDEAFDDDEPEDNFLDMALRTNIDAIDKHGHQVTWAPRCWDAADLDAYIGHRPYVSVAWSTTCVIPWVVNEGWSEQELLFESRVSDEHNTGVGVQVRAELLGVAKTAASLSPTTNATPIWQPHTFTLSVNEPLEGTRFTDLIVWQKGTCPAQTIDRYDTVTVGDVAFYRFSFGGSYVSHDQGSLFDDPGSARPSIVDRHLMVFEAENDLSLHDILYADSVDGFNYAWVRPVSSYRDAFPARTRPLGYWQIRSMQIKETFDLTRFRAPDSRYVPQQTVEGRDAVQHALEVNKRKGRWRPMWIGPRGTAGNPEAFPTGYGRKFEFVDGSATFQTWYVAEVSPRQDAPKVRVMINAISAWRESGHETLISDMASLQAASGRATWTVRASLCRYVDGSSIPAVIAQGQTTLPITSYPTNLSPVSTFLLQEQIYDGLSRGVASLSAGWAYKEGQLFEEDLQLIEKIAIEFDAPGFDPSVSDYPCFVHVEASVDLTGATFPDPSDGVVAIAADKLRLFTVGNIIAEAAS